MLATRPFVSKLFDRRGPAIVLYPAAISTAAAYFFIANANHDFMIMAAGILIGIGFGGTMNTTLALSVKITPKHRLSIANATYYLSIDLAAALGPTIAGALIAFSGYNWAFILAGSYTLLAIPLFFFVIGRYYRKFL